MERHTGRSGWARVPASTVLVALAVAIVWIPSAAARADITVLDGPAACCARAVRVDPPDPPRELRSVGLIGDSLSVGITDDRFQNGPPIQDVFTARGVSAWTATTIGMTMPRGLDVLASRAAQVSSTDVVVVALGTNDITGGTDRSAWRGSIERIVRQVGGSNPGAVVVWVDLDFPRLASRARAFNEVLHEFADAEPTLAVCAWAAAVSANPQWLGGDGLHLNGTGYAARRDVIVGCVDDVQLD